jgi:hypothetical protein
MLPGRYQLAMEASAPTRVTRSDLYGLARARSFIESAR